jgi:hypothetical protein
MLHAGAVGDHHVVEQIAVIGLVDLRGALHRLRGQPHLVTDQLGAAGDLAVGDFGGDRVGVLHGDAGPGFRQLNGLFAFLLRGDEDIGGLVAIGFGQHDGSLHFRAPNLEHDPEKWKRRRRYRVTGTRRAG